VKKVVLIFRHQTTIGTSIIVAIGRITIRVHRFRRFYTDDYFLLLALAALIGSNALFFAAVPELYLFASAFLGQVLLYKSLFQAAADTSVLACAAEILSWITIFAVKVSFLFYFRNLIERVHRLTVWWRIVLSICIPVAIISICSTFIVCPYVGSEIVC
jgi:hypothetical protein